MIELHRRASVRNAPIDPSRLIFEITETAAIANIERARSASRSGLADLGCRFALDDFGAGFGSFYYLKHLPFDFLKIDGEFIRELDRRARPTSSSSRRSSQIARGLGKHDDRRVRRDRGALAVLAELGVDFAQGYHVGRPRPVLPDPGFT